MKLDFSVKQAMKVVVVLVCAVAVIATSIVMINGDDDKIKNKNDELWNTIHHHRELFTSMSGVDYTPDIRKRIRLLPPDDVMDDWYNDYKDMQSSMIYGEKPSFEELIEKMRELENLFHNTKH